MPDRQSVTICGPNLRDQSKGSFHVHATGCADLRRQAHREPEYRNGWPITVATRAEIVQTIYPPKDFDYDPSEWSDYDDIYLFPCVRDLPYS